MLGPLHTFKLQLLHEDPLSAADTLVDTCVFVPPVLPSEWSLCSHPLSDVVLVGSEDCLEILSPLAQMGPSPLVKGV